MLTRLFRAAVAFVAVLAAYLAYATLAVPWIEPTVSRSNGLLPSGEAGRGTHHAARRRILESLFPADAWELTDPRVKVLETDYGMLLLRDYHTQEGGQLAIHPCTMVLEVPADGDRPPRYLALQAPEGAVLQFDRSIDLRRAEIGKPVGGRLQGEVRIFSPPTQPDGGDRLNVVTQNVQMDARRVWTPHGVSFRFGRSYGQGRNLTIELSPAEGPRAYAPGALSIAGVRLLELAHLETLHLEAPPEGLFSDALKDQRKSAPRDKLQREALAAPLEVKCRGPFRFDFEVYVASFEDDVDVIRLHPDGLSDQVNCRVLEIHFAAPKNMGLPGLGRESASSREAKDSDAASGAGVVRKIVAVGQPVFVRAPSIGAFVQADRLEYDLTTRRIRLENRRLLPPGQDGGAVGGNAVLEHQGRYFAAPRLQYELGAPNRIGKLWAAGPGVFRGPLPKTSKHLPDLPEGEQIEITWQGQIHLRPHEGQHVASVTGGAQARVGDIGAFEAGDLHLWLREVPQPPSLGASREDDPEYRVVPDRLLAQGGVNLRSPRFSGATRKLEVWFEDAEPLADEKETSPLGSSDHDQRRPRRQAFDLRSDLVQLRLLRRGEKTLLEDATLRGNVLLRETQTEKPGETPLVVTGDLVELRGGGGPQLRLVVLGDPQRDIRAHAGARGVVYSGWQLHVDQTIGRAWVDGPGRLTLPLQQRAFSQFASAPARPDKRPSSVTIHWRKGLDFDGNRVLIHDRVETRGEGQTLRSDSLQAFLAQPLNLADPEQFDQVEVARLLFGGRPEDAGGVILENQTFENGELTSLDRGEIRYLDIDLIGGRMYGPGPGWVESVRRGFELTGSPRAAASPVVAPSKPRGLTFVRVDFLEAITGQAFSRDLSQWKMTFHKDVETIVGPIDRWEQRLHANSPAGLGPRGMLLTSRELSITQMGVGPEGDPHMELAATGRPHIESLSFTADGERLSYDGAKGLLVLEGGRDDARFWHRQNTGIEVDGAAQRIQYWPQENRLDADLRELELGGFRNAFHPARSRRR